jgi:hypothetical protein
MIGIKSDLFGDGAYPASFGFIVRHRTMRTTLFLLSGFLLLAASTLLGRLFSSNFPGATYTATWIFIALWLVIASANLWVGVAKAGYTLNEEFPIFLLIFVVPTVVAIFLKWRII